MSFSQLTKAFPKRKRTNSLLISINTCLPCQNVDFGAIFFWSRVGLDWWGPSPSASGVYIFGSSARVVTSRGCVVRGQRLDVCSDCEWAIGYARKGMMVSKEEILRQRRQRQKPYFVHDGKAYDATLFELRSPHTRTEVTVATFKVQVRRAPGQQKFRRIRENDELQSDMSSSSHESLLSNDFWHARENYTKSL